MTSRSSAFTSAHWKRLWRRPAVLTRSCNAACTDTPLRPASQVHGSVEYMLTPPVSPSEMAQTSSM